MAITASAGYDNLPSGNWLPSIYSQKVLKYFRRSSVVEGITNTDYAGEIENYGDTVRIIKEPTISVSSYTKGSQTNLQNLADDQTTLVVDTANYFAFKVDDIEERQSHVNWESLATSSGAYALKRKYDRDVLEAISTTSGINAGTAVTANTGDLAHSVIAESARLLDDNEVPEENRWFVAPPIFYEQLGAAGSKVMDMSVMGSSGESPLRNGLVSEVTIAGMKLYKSTALNRSGTDIITISGTSNAYFCMGGHMSAAATASHIAKTEVVRDPDSFSDVVRGLHVYGSKVLRAEAITRTAVVLT
jgi:hypothetical protein